jgi:hypothetical protein
MLCTGYLGSLLSSSSGRTSGAGKVESFGPRSCLPFLKRNVGLPCGLAAASHCARVGCLYPASWACGEGVKIKFWCVQTLVFVLGGIVMLEDFSAFKSL